MNDLAAMTNMEAKETILSGACLPSLLLGGWLGIGILSHLELAKIRTCL